MFGFVNYQETEELPLAVSSVSTNADTFFAIAALKRSADSWSGPSVISQQSIAPLSNFDIPKSLKRAGSFDQPVWKSYPNTVPGDNTGSARLFNTPVLFRVPGFTFNQAILPSVTITSVSPSLGQFDVPSRLRKTPEWPQLPYFTSASVFVPQSFDATIKLKRQADWTQSAPPQVSISFVPLSLFDPPQRKKQPSEWQQFLVSSFVVSYTGTTFDPAVRIKIVPGWDQLSSAASPITVALQSFDGSVKPRSGVSDWGGPPEIVAPFVFTGDSFYGTTKTFRIPDWWLGVYAIDLLPITDTIFKMQLPVNCVLAGQQGYEQGGYDIEDNAPNYNVDVKVSFGGGGLLSDAESTFTVKKNNRGYD